MGTRMMAMLEVGSEGLPAGAPALARGGTAEGKERVNVGASPVSAPPFEAIFDDGFGRSRRRAR